MIQDEETKSRAKELDQWYTKDEVAEQCVDKMIELGLLSEFVNAIEPSAGEGAFIRALDKVVDNEYIFGYDIDPKCEKCEQANFLENDFKFNRAESIVIGNPPYGKKAALAVQFINKAADISDVIGFIVPITLAKSYSAQKNVRQDLELIHEMELPKNSFIFEGKDKDVPSVFQIWRKKFTDIRLQKPETEHDDLEVRIYNKMPTAEKWLDWDWDIAIKRNTKNGEFVTRGEKASSDYHWILVKGKNQSVVDTLLSIDYSKLNDNKMTAGMGKADIVEAYKGACNGH